MLHYDGMSATVRGRGRDMHLDAPVRCEYRIHARNRVGSDYVFVIAQNTSDPRAAEITSLAGAVLLRNITGRFLADIADIARSAIEQYRNEKRPPPTYNVRPHVGHAKPDPLPPRAHTPIEDVVAAAAVAFVEAAGRSANSTRIANATRRVRELRPFTCGEACVADMRAVVRSARDVVGAYSLAMGHALTTGKLMPRAEVEALLDGVGAPAVSAALRWARRLGRRVDFEDEVRAIRAAAQRSQSALRAVVEAALVSGMPDHLVRDVFADMHRAYGASPSPHRQSVRNHTSATHGLGPKSEATDGGGGDRDSSETKKGGYMRVFSGRAARLGEAVSHVIRRANYAPQKAVGVARALTPGASGISIVLVAGGVLVAMYASSSRLVTAAGLGLLALVIAANFLFIVPVAASYGLGTIATALNGDVPLGRPDLLLPYFQILQEPLRAAIVTGPAAIDFGAVSALLRAEFRSSIHLVLINTLRSTISVGPLGTLFGLANGAEPVFDALSGSVIDTPGAYVSRIGVCDPTAACAQSDSISPCYGSIDPSADDILTRECTAALPCIDPVEGVFGTRQCPGFFRVGWHLPLVAANITINPQCEAAHGYIFTDGVLLSPADVLDEARSLAVNTLRSLQVWSRKAARGDRVSLLWTAAGLLAFLPLFGGFFRRVAVLAIMSNVAALFVPGIAARAVDVLLRARTVPVYTAVADIALDFLRSPNATPMHPLGSVSAAEALCATYALPQVVIVVVGAYTVLLVAGPVVVAGLPFTLLGTLLANAAFALDFVLGLVFAAAIGLISAATRRARFRRTLRKARGFADTYAEPKQATTLTKQNSIHHGFAGRLGEDDIGVLRENEIGDDDEYIPYDPDTYPLV